jgi:hypothetical protein
MPFATESTYTLSAKCISVSYDISYDIDTELFIKQTIYFLQICEQIMNI